MKTYKQIVERKIRKEFAKRFVIGTFGFPTAEELIEWFSSFALSIHSRDMEWIKEKIPKKRVLNQDNPQYVLGWNACRSQLLQQVEEEKV